MSSGKNLRRKRKASPVEINVEEDLQLINVEKPQIEVVETGEEDTYPNEERSFESPETNISHPRSKRVRKKPKTFIPENYPPAVVITPEEEDDDGLSGMKHECKHCPSIFNHLSSLARHISAHHPDLRHQELRVQQIREVSTYEHRPTSQQIDRNCKNRQMLHSNYARQKEVKERSDSVVPEMSEDVLEVMDEEREKGNDADDDATKILKVYMMDKGYITNLEKAYGVKAVRLTPGRKPKNTKSWAKKPKKSESNRSAGKVEYESDNKADDDNWDDNNPEVEPEEGDLKEEEAEGGKGLQEYQREKAKDALLRMADAFDSLPPDCLTGALELVEQARDYIDDMLAAEEAGPYLAAEADDPEEELDPEG